MGNTTDICEICGKPLIFLTQEDSGKNGGDGTPQSPMESFSSKCYYCGKVFEAQIRCPDGHYICDSCHSKEALQILSEICSTTTLTDPYALATQILHHPQVKMYGPEHHIMVPAVLLTALKNYQQTHDTPFSPVGISEIQEGIRRAEKVPGGWCGFYGTCGAAIGAGITLSVLLHATPSTDHPRSLANSATAQALRKIADNHEHCCKRSVYHAISAVLSILRKEFQVDLALPPFACEFTLKNEKCEQTRCVYYPR